MGWREWLGIVPKEAEKREPPKKRDRAFLGVEKKQEPRYLSDTPHIEKDENVADFLIRAKKEYGDRETNEGRFNYARAGFEAIRDRRRQRDTEKYGDNWYGRMWKHLLETDRGMAVLMGGRAVLGASSIVVAATMLRGDAALFLGPALYAFGTAEYANAMLRGVLSFGEERMRMMARAARRETKATLKNLNGKERFNLTHESLAKIYDSDQECMRADKRLKAKETANNLVVFGVPKAIAAALFVGLRAPVPLGWHDFDGQALPPEEQFHRVWLELKTGGMHYVRELGGGIAEMGKPIWRNTEEAAKFVYGSAAWGAAAGIFADIPEKIGTATVSLAKKTLGSLEKILGRKPTPKDIEKIRIKPIAGSAKKTAKFQPPEQTAELEDISGRIIAQAQAWLEKHPIDLPDTDGKDAPPEQSSSSFPAARTTKLITEKTAELSRSEQEAMGLPQPVSAEEMQENLSREELFEGKPELAEKDELTDKERKENAAVQRAHILQATGLGSGNRASYREFNQALKDFVKAGDEAQLRVVSSFLKEHGEDLIGEEGAPVLMWADRRHLEKLIDKRLGTAGQAAEEPSRPDTHAPPTPVVPAHVPPQPDAENVSQEPSAPHLPPMSDVHEESERLRKIAEEETKPLHALPDALLSQWDAPVPAQQAAGDEDLTLEKLLAEPLAKLGSRPIDTVRSQMGADAKRLRESGDARGLRNQGARAMLRGLLINRIDPETLRRLRGGIWTTENISDPIMKKIAEEVEGIHRLSNEDIAHKLMKELKPKVAPKIDLEEDRLYRKVFADKVLRKDVSGGMNVYKDESEGFVYRGPDLAALRTVDDIVSRARLNVSLTSAAIDRLDVLAKDFGFMYRVGMPTSGTSPSENRDSVTIYFPDGSSDRVISVLRDFAEDEAFKRGRPDDLYGKRVTEHFYLGEDFAEKLPKDEALKFLATLQRMHRQLYEIVSGYVGDTGEITEKQFHVVKEFLAPFGFPIRYSKEQGVLFNVPSRNKRHSVA